MKKRKKRVRRGGSGTVELDLKTWMPTGLLHSVYRL